MTAKQPHDSSASNASADGGAKAATTREAKGSVHEAIGKLIGDDAVRDRGTAEKRAGAADAVETQKPRRR